MKLVYLLLTLINDTKIVLLCAYRFFIKNQLSDFHSGPRLLSRSKELLFFWLYLVDTYFIVTQDRRNLSLKKKLRGEFKEKLIQNGEKEKGGAVASYESSELTKDLVTELLKKKEPFVIRGYFKDSLAVKNWSLDYFIENYGEVPVLGGEPDSNECKVLPLKNVRKEGFYIRNVEALFRKDKKLGHQVGLERLNQDGFDKQSWLLSIQLFIASTTKARSAYHNTKADNFFIQINGKKKWWFVSPMYTHGMEPYFNKAMGYNESKVGHAEEPNPDCSLYAHLPVLECELDPGDLLFSPSLWWHSVANLTAANVGLSTRWFSDNTETYYPLSLLQICNPRFMGLKLLFCEAVIRHMRTYKGENSNYHPDRDYSSIYDKQTEKTLFEHASHQMDFQRSLKKS